MFTRNIFKTYKTLVVVVLNVSIRTHKRVKITIVLPSIINFSYFVKL